MQIKPEWKSPVPTVGQFLSGLFEWSGIFDFYAATADESTKSKKALQDKLSAFAREEQLLDTVAIQEIINESLENIITHPVLRELCKQTVDMALWFYKLSAFRSSMQLPSDQARKILLMQIPGFFSGAVIRGQQLPWQKLDMGSPVSFPKGVKWQWWFLPQRDPKSNSWIMPRRAILQWWQETNGYSDKLALARGLQISPTTLNKWMSDGLSNSKHRSSLFVSIQELEKQESKTTSEPGMLTSLSFLLLYSNLIENFCHWTLENYGEVFLSDMLDVISDTYTKFLEWEERTISQPLQKKLKTLPPSDCPTEQFCRYEELQTELRQGRAKELIPDLQNLMETEQFKGPHKDFLEELVASSTKLTEDINYRNGEINALDDKLSAAVSTAEETPTAENILKSRNIIRKLRPQFEQYGNMVFLCYQAEGYLSMLEDNFAKTLQSYQRAFHMGRYSAGPLMLRLIEGYLTIAAYCHKHRREKAFEGIPPTRTTINYLWKWVQNIYLFELIPKLAPNSQLLRLQGKEIDEIIDILAATVVTEPTKKIQRWTNRD